MNKVKRLAVATLMVCAAAAKADPGNEPVAADGNDLQRQRINAVRNQKLSEMAAQDAACLSRFAVTDCQNAVGRRRRDMLADLKRQEARLDEVDRRQKGVDQLQRSEDKAMERAQSQSDGQTNRQKNTLEERQEAQREKAIKHKNQAKTPVPATPVNKLPSGLDAATMEANRAAFSEKQQAAEQRRLDRDKRLQEKAGGSVALPRSP